MNPDLQSSPQPNGSHHETVGHRPLNEEVSQCAAEAVKDEVLHVSPQRRRDTASLFQRMEDRATRVVLRKPMKVLIMAVGAGAMLALVLEHSFKKLISLSR